MAKTNEFRVTGVGRGESADAALHKDVLASKDGNLASDLAVLEQLDKLKLLGRVDLTRFVGAEALAMLDRPA
jgi:hypothetical protein